MRYLWIGLCYSMAHVPSLVLRYVPFAEKVNARQKKQLMGCYAAGLLLSTLLYWELAREDHISIAFYKMNLLLFCILMGIVNLVVIRGYVKEQLFTFGLTALLVLMMYAIAAYLAEQIGYADISQALVLESLIGVLLYALCHRKLNGLMRMTVTPFLDIKGHDYWHMIWFIPIAMFLGSMFAFGINGYTATPLQLISRLLIGVATVLMCQNIARDYRRIQEQKQMMEQIEQQRGYYYALTESVRQEREARHNFKHQLAAVRSCLEDGSTEELEQYYEDAKQKLAGVTDIPYTGNAAADGVLYHYAQIARENGVTFSVCCRLDGLAISDMDLSCILGNALDNAMTACKGCETDRYIRVAAEQDGECFLLTVDNSFDGVLLQDGKKIFSGKRKEGEEGIGIRSMRQICEKYGGTCRFEAAGNRFEASFLLMSR